jgi:hypothetical protein
LDRTSKREKLKGLCQLVGYANYDKFLRRLELWKTLLSWMPRTYCDAIGVDYHVLDFVAELDVQEYQNALNSNFPISNYVVRVMAAIYAPVRLPYEMTEPEAIEHIRSFQQTQKQLQCCINLTGLKTTYVGLNGEVTCHYFPPVMTKTETRLTFSPCSTTGNFL